MKHRPQHNADYLPYPEIYADYWPHHKFDLPIRTIIDKDEYYTALVTFLAEQLAEAYKNHDQHR
jgi:hypothetical protein